MGSSFTTINRLLDRIVEAAPVKAKATLPKPDHVSGNSRGWIDPTGNFYSVMEFKDHGIWVQKYFGHNVGRDGLVESGWIRIGDYQSDRYMDLNLDKASDKSLDVLEYWIQQAEAGTITITFYRTGGSKFTEFTYIDFITSGKSLKSFLQDQLKWLLTPQSATSTGSMWVGRTWGQERKRSRMKREMTTAAGVGVGAPAGTWMYRWKKKRKAGTRIPRWARARDSAISIKPPSI